MKIIGPRVVLRDERRTGDDDDFFRWLNLAEWNYYDRAQFSVRDEPLERIEFAISRSKWRDSS